MPRVGGGVAILGNPSLRMLSLSLLPEAKSVRMSAPIHSHTRCCSPLIDMTDSRTELLREMAVQTRGHSASRSRWVDLRKRASRIWRTEMVEGQVGSRRCRASYQCCCYVVNAVAYLFGQDLKDGLDELLNAIGALLAF